MVSLSSAGVMDWLYFSELLDLKLSFYFSALVLKVTNCGLEMLRDEFAEKVSASVFAIYFLVVASVLFFMGCSRAVCWIFPEIFQIILLIVFVLVLHQVG